MLTGRWRIAVLLFGCVLLGAGACLADQGTLVDLRVSQIALDPASSVVSGESVTASVVVERSGPPLAQDAEVEITWRRRDREEPCGASAGVFPAGEGPLAQQFVVIVPTADLAPGSYEIIATVDPANALPEASESNNRLAVSLEILPPKPELHPVRAEVAPTPPLAWGETATVIAGVANTGRAAAGPFHVSFAVFPIYCVDERTGERWVIAPTGAQNAKGFYGWQFVPDPTGGAGPQTVGLAALIAALPAEAWIVFAEEQASGLEQNRMVDVHAVFSTGLALRALLTTSGTRDGAIGSSTMALVSAADAGRIESCTTTYAVRVSIEDAFGVADEDPTNNALDMALSVRPSSLELPDLLPIAASFSRAMPLNWDDDMDVTVLVANRGGGAAPAGGTAPIAVSFSYRPTGAAAWTPLATRTISQLGIDEDTSTDTVEATIDASPGQLNLAPGSYELRIVVDEANVIPEQDEQNNEIVIGFSVQGIELHPVGLEVSSSSIRQGDSVDVVATIENTGDRSLEGFSVGFFVGDERFDTFTYRAATASDPGLEQEDRTRAKGTLHTEDLAPGMYSLRIVVDPDNKIPELDETNNEIRATITVQSPAERLAELYVSEVTLSPASPIAAGEAVLVRALVRNGGTIDAGRFSVAFVVVRDDGTTWGVGRIDCAAGATSTEGAQVCACQTADGLARGAAQELTYMLWTVGWPEGRYALHVWVDPPAQGAADGEVREEDETNNEMILTFSLGHALSGGITAGVNLVVDAVSLQPASAPAGTSSAVVLTTITNRGAQAAGPFAVDVRWVREGGAALSLARFQVDGLDPSQSVTLRQQISLGSIGWTCGTHTFQVVVDSSEDVDEDNEADNVGSGTFQVDCGQGASFGPDLAVELSVPTARDGAVTVGCPAAAEVRVTNRGGLAAGAFRVELRQSGSVIGIQDVIALATQASATVHFDLPTASPVTLALSAFVDSEGRVAESDESNNTATLTLAVAPGAASTATRIGGPYRGAVGAVLVDPASGILVAAADDGTLHAFARGTPPSPLYDAGLDDAAKITGLALDRGTAVRTIYVTTASGNLHRFALSTGSRIGTPVHVGGTATCLALDVAGTAYVGTEAGVAVVKRTGATAVTVALGSRVIDLAVDASGTLVYALTTSALYAVSASSQSVACTAGSFGADATALTLGPNGVFVGTSTGRVIAYSPCMSYGSLGTAMLRSWNVDLSASGGSVASLAAYAETSTDPVYVALCENGKGRVVGLSLAGRMLWTTEPEATFGCFGGQLVADRRRGRATAVETDGTIRVVSDTGEPLVVEEALAGPGRSVRSGAAFDSVLSEVSGASRLSELYYIGTSDGSLYVVTIARGSCP